MHKRDLAKKVFSRDEFPYSETTKFMLSWGMDSYKVKNRIAAWHVESGNDLTDFDNATLTLNVAHVQKQMWIEIGYTFQTNISPSDLIQRSFYDLCQIEEGAFISAKNIRRKQAIDVIENMQAYIAWLDEAEIIESEIKKEIGVL